MHVPSTHAKMEETAQLTAAATTAVNVLRGLEAKTVLKVRPDWEAPQGYIYITSAGVSSYAYTFCAAFVAPRH